MKVSVQAELLQKKLTFLSHFVSLKPQLPILASIHVKTGKDQIILSATDLDSGIETAVPAIIDEEGDIAIPARTFIELVNSFSKEDIQLTVSEDTLHIKTTTSKSSISLLPVAEFPKLYEELGDPFCTLSKQELIVSLERVLFAASTDSGKPAYSGMLLRFEEGSERKDFLLVSTDGFRLSLTHVQANNSSPTTTTTSLIIPSRILKEVTTLKEEVPTIDIFTSTTQNQIIFRFAQTLLIGRLVASEYPPFERIIPSDFSTELSCKREELLKAVRICSIFARDSANVIKIAIEKEKLVVSSQGSMSGENQVEVKAEVKGEENAIAFNAKYLLDFLTNVQVEEIGFEMVGPLNPGVFKISEDPSYLHIIMPIRLQD
jgi:DNA polymerase-3 subunit beta